MREDVLARAEQVKPEFLRPACLIGRTQCSSQVTKLARKYRPLVPVLRDLALSPDAPLEPDVKDMITHQLEAAENRFVVILD